MKMHLSLLLIFICVACNGTKKSPDYSKQQDTKLGSTSTDTSQPTSGQSSAKENIILQGGNVATNVGEKAAVVEETGDPTYEPCAFYPREGFQPNWSAYLEQMQPKEKGNVSSAKVIRFYNQESYEQEVMISSEKVITTFPKRLYRFKVAYEALTNGKCVYPALTVYASADESLILVDEWKTKNFYVPQHFKDMDNQVWMNRYQNGFLAEAALYKKRLSSMEMQAFVRSVYMFTDVHILDSNDPIKSPDKMRVVINNRSGVIFGNVSINWFGRSYSYELGVLEVYKWQSLNGKTVYQLEWGTDGPGFAFDPDGERARAASGNFDSTKNRIRILFIEPDLNEEVEFFGEFIDLETSGIISFVGKREKREERN